MLFAAVEALAQPLEVVDAPFEDDFSVLSAADHHVEELVLFEVVLDGVLPGGLVLGFE